MPTARSMQVLAWSRVRYQKRKEGRNENVSAFFHISSHAVVGRLACLSVVPVFVIFNVTPPPE